MTIVLKKMDDVDLISDALKEAGKVAVAHYAGEAVSDSLNLGETGKLVAKGVIYLAGSHMVGGIISTK